MWMISSLESTHKSWCDDSVRLYLIEEEISRLRSKGESQLLFKAYKSNRNQIVYLLARDKYVAEISEEFGLLQMSNDCSLIIDCSRPDIMFAVCASVLGFKSLQKTSHLSAVKADIFSNLKGKPKWALVKPRTERYYHFLQKTHYMAMQKANPMWPLLTTHSQYVASYMQALVLKIHTNDNVADRTEQAFDVKPNFSSVVSNGMKIHKLHIGLKGGNMKGL
ncbi:hypothetical protein Tco_0169709 [Tanacetum coccineum]